MKRPEDAPKDNYNFVHIVFYLVGIGILLPWNFFINAKDYWHQKLRTIEPNATYPDHVHFNPIIPTINEKNESNNDSMGTVNLDDRILNSLQLKWNSYLSIATTIPNLIMLLLNALFGHKLSLSPKLFVSLFGIFVCFIITDAFTSIETDGFQTGFLWITLTTVVMITIFMGLLQGTLVGLAGTFPSTYMAFLLQGQAVGAIVAAVVNILSMAVHSGDANLPSKSAFWSFLIAAIYIAFDAFVLVVMTKTDVFEYYTRGKEANQEQIEKNGQMNSLDEPSNAKKTNGAHEDVNSSKTLRRRISNISNDIEIHASSSELTPLLGDKQVQCNTSTISILKKIWIWILSAFITFAICLSIYPSIASLVESTERGNGRAWNDKYFTPVGCFLNFGINNYIGRTLASILKWPKPTKTGAYITLVISVARIGFVPMFLFCNASPLNRNVTAVYFPSDTVFLLLSAIFSITNGYIGNIVLMFGPKMLSNPEDQGRAASILLFFLGLGLAVGACLSYPLVHLL